MSESKKNLSSFTLKITYDNDTFQIEEIEELNNDNNEIKEILVFSPNQIDERLINALTVEDMQELHDCYDFNEN